MNKPKESRDEPWNRGLIMHDKHPIIRLIRGLRNALQFATVFFLVWQRIKGFDQSQGMFHDCLLGLNGLPMQCWTIFLYNTSINEKIIEFVRVSYSAL